MLRKGTKEENREKDIKEEFDYIKKNFFDGYKCKYIQVCLNGIIEYNEILDKIEKDLGYEPISFGGGGQGKVKYLFRRLDKDSIWGE